MENQPKVSIKKIVSQPTYQDFLPAFSYVLENLAILDNAGDLKTMFREFLKTNENLIIQEMGVFDEVAYEGYVRGFRNAVAIFELWVDSINVEQLPKPPEETV